MSKCVKCKSRKGKRFCPSLSGLICSLCCGMYREKEINCPDSCKYLVKHRTYQEKKDWIKQAEKSKGIKEKHSEIYTDEKMAWLAFNVEKTIRDYAISDPSVNDRAVIEALEYTLNKIEKGKKLIYIPGEITEEENKFGEIIYKNMESIRYSRGLVLPESEQIYSKEEKMKCLESLILSAKLFSKGELDARNYINEIIKRIEQILQRKEEKRIITPH